ncbi:MAG: TolC family protein [Alcaligenaceae bacterium]
MQILIRETLATHPAIRGQEFLMQSSQFNVDAAKWQFYPTPSLSAEQGRFDASDPTYQGDNRVYTMRLQQPLWTGGRLTAGLDKARANEEASKGSAQEVAQSLALSVVDGCGDFGAGELKVIAYKNSLGTHDTLLKRVQRRVKEGASPDSDLILAQSRFSSTESDLAAAQAQRQVALERLRELVGRSLISPEICTVVGAQFPVMVAQSSDVLVNQALDSSPGLAKLKSNAESIRQDIELAKADLSPELYVRLERQYGNFNVPGYSGVGLNRIFVGMSTRFGAGLSNVSVIDSARAKYESALTDIDTRRRQLREFVRSEYTLGLSADARRNFLYTSFKDSEKVSQSWDRQFLAGRKQWQDVMNAAREHAQLEVQLADATAQAWTANWKLLVLAEGVEATVKKQIVVAKPIKK